MAERKCQWCGSEYLPRQENQRFCSSVCSSAWHNEERRRAVEMLRNTYHGRAMLDAVEGEGGRFAAVGPENFGSPLPVPPHLRDPVGPEPPLGVDIETVPEEARR